MANRVMRVGVIGLGGVSFAHLEGYRHLSDIQVVAGADVNPVRATDMANRYGFTPYTDFRELLRTEKPDIVSVLTTVNSHREIVEACADHGVHVLCEKPLAVRLEDADAMIARCRDRGVKLFYGASYRFLPAVLKAKEIIESGQLGNVQLLTESLLGGKGIEGYSPMGFAHYPEGGPGGSGWGMMDHGIHIVDVFGWLIGSQIDGVYGRGQISGAPPAAEFAILDFKNGAMGQLTYCDSSWSTDLPAEGLFSMAPDWGDLMSGTAGSARGGKWQEQPASMRVFGAKGALRIYHYPNQLFLRTASGIEQIPIDGPPNPGHFGKEMVAMFDCVRNDTDPAVPAQVGREALRTVLAVYESMKTRKRVTL